MTQNKNIRIENETEMPELLTVGQAARLLGIHIDTLRRWDKEGVLKAVRLENSGWRRYRKSEIMTFLDSSAANSASLTNLSQIEILNQMAELLHMIWSHRDSCVMVEAVARKATQLIGANRGSVVTIADDRKSLQLLVGVDLNDPDLIVQPLFTEPKSLELQPLFVEMLQRATTAQQNNQPMPLICVADTFYDSRTTRGYFHQFNTRALLIAPIYVRTLSAPAFLIFAWTGRPHEFSDEELAFTEALSHQLAIGLENCHLYQLTQTASAMPVQR